MGRKRTVKSGREKIKLGVRLIKNLTAGEFRDRDL